MNLSETDIPEKFSVFRYVRYALSQDHDGFKCLKYCGIKTRDISNMSHWNALQVKKKRTGSKHNLNITQLWMKIENNQMAEFHKYQYCCNSNCRCFFFVHSCFYAKSYTLFSLYTCCCCVYYVSVYLFSYFSICFFPHSVYGARQNNNSQIANRGERFYGFCGNFSPMMSE